VIAEIALAVILVIGSGLMIRAFWKLQQVNTGFDPSGVLSFSLNLPSSKYDNAQRLQFVNSLEQKLSTLPGGRRSGGRRRAPFRGRHRARVR
jgi:hypothetical protein